MGHTPPPRARSVPPAPTVPPPLPDEPTMSTRAARWKDRVEPWHYLVGLAVVLAGAGAAAADWSRSKATVEQLDDAKRALTSQLGAAQGAHDVQLSVLQQQLQALQVRQATVEGQLVQVISLSQRLLDVTLATARATGARVPPEPSHPPSGGLP